MYSKKECNLTGPSPWAARKWSKRSAELWNLEFKDGLFVQSAVKEGYSVKGADTFGTALIDFMIGTDNANRMVAANRHPARGRATKIIALPRDMIRF